MSAVLSLLLPLPTSVNGGSVAWTAVHSRRPCATTWLPSGLCQGKTEHFYILSPEIDLFLFYFFYLFFLLCKKNKGLDNSPRNSRITGCPPRTAFSVYVYFLGRKTVYMQNIAAILDFRIWYWRHDLGIGGNSGNSREFQPEFRNSGSIWRCWE